MLENNPSVGHFYNFFLRDYCVTVMLHVCSQLVLHNAVVCPEIPHLLRRGAGTEDAADSEHSAEALLIYTSPGESRCNSPLL